jgi:hypothetical protein
MASGSVGGGQGNSGDYNLWGGNSQLADVWDPFGIFHTNPLQYQSVTSSKQTSGQQNLMGMLTNYLGQYANGQQLPSYGGQLTAPINSTQQKSLSDILGYKSPTSELTGVTADSLQKIISGNTGLPEVMRANYEQNIEKPLLKTYKDVAMPELQGTYASKGLSYGSSKKEAVDTATNNLMDSLSKGRASLESTITQDTIQNEMTGMNTANSVSANALQQILGISGAESSAGATEQQTQQASDTAKYQQWLRNQPGTNPAMQQIMQLLNIMPNQTDVVTNSGSGGLMNACWIWTHFDGEHGITTEIMRKFRDERYGKGSLVDIGYKAIGKYVLPLLKKYKLVQKIIWSAVYIPLTNYGSGSKSIPLKIYAKGWELLFKSVGFISKKVNGK